MEVLLDEKGRGTKSGWEHWDGPENLTKTLGSKLNPRGGKGDKAIVGGQGQGKKQRR